MPLGSRRQCQRDAYLLFDSVEAWLKVLLKEQCKALGRKRGLERQGNLHARVKMTEKPNPRAGLANQSKNALPAFLCGLSVLPFSSESDCIPLSAVSVFLFLAGRSSRPYSCHFSEWRSQVLAGAFG